jgi:hypothetical protein
MKRNAFKILVGTAEEVYILEDLDVDKRTTL